MKLKLKQETLELCVHAYVYGFVFFKAYIRRSNSIYISISTIIGLQESKLSDEYGDINK